MTLQKVSATLHKPLKIQCFKTMKCSTANMQISFLNSTNFFFNIVKIFTYKIVVKISKEMRMNIEMMAKNMSKQEIAKELIISRSSISRHSKCFISTKMQSPSKAAALNGTETDQDIKSSAKENYNTSMSNMVSVDTIKCILR